MAPTTKPPPILGKTFFKEWREFRKKNLSRRDFTQDAVAEKMNIERSSLTKIELGNIPYQQQYVEAAARIYDCTIADILMRDPTDNSSVWALLDLLKKLPPDQVRVIHGLATSMLKEKRDQESKS